MPFLRRRSRGNQPNSNSSNGNSGDAQSTNGNQSNGEQTQGTQEQGLDLNGNQARPRNGTWYNKTFASLAALIANPIGSPGFNSGILNFLWRRDSEERAIEEERRRSGVWNAIIGIGTGFISWISLKNFTAVFLIAAAINARVGGVCAFFVNNHFLTPPVIDVVRVEAGKIITRSGTKYSSGLMIYIADPVSLAVIGLSYQ